ncbi:hypothetical protein [Pedobacter glucosidilyticus]|uniref:hypothetical protein n=1 Tax=Pedobacter glucosidilyticus TaxID=1122941 RepID=UPI0026F10DE6|nr:hypothetical protein [Pedobacter glucosidilyticus]
MKKTGIQFLILSFLAITAYAQEIKLSKGVSHNVKSNYVGLNGNVGTNNMPWDNNNLLNGFVKSGARTIRYPAGTIANTWDWDRGWIDPTVPDSLLINWVVSEGWKNFKISYPLENFKKAIDASKAEPVYVLNMLSKDLEHALRGLRRAKALGLPVRYVEMGNELYFNLKLEMSRFPTPEDYGKTCYEWIKAIKEEFPEVKCAVVSWEAVRSERHKNWTERVLKYATNADAVIFHVYTPFGLDGAQERANNQAGQEGLTTGGNLSNNLKLRQQQELALLNIDSNFQKMMLKALEVANRHKEMRVPLDKKIWATEFNVRADNSAIRGTWANTLFISTFYLAFLKNPQIEITHFHNIIGPIFGALYNNDRGFSHLQNEKIISKPWSLSAGGLAMKTFAQLTEIGGEATEIIFKNNTLLASNQHHSLQALQGWVINNSSSSRAIIINFSSQRKKITIPDFLHKHHYSMQSAVLQHYVMDIEGLKIMTGITAKELFLEPYSITTFLK